jgi:hypothetical protein
VRRKCFAARAVPVAVAILGMGFQPGIAAERVTDGLVAFWKFEETSGKVLKDETGAHDAAIVNTPELDVEGKVGSARLRRFPSVETALVPEFPTQQILVDFSQGAVRHLAGFGGD